MLTSAEASFIREVLDTCDPAMTCGIGNAEIAMARALIDRVEQFSDDINKLFDKHRIACDKGLVPEVGDAIEILDTGGRWVDAEVMGIYPEGVIQYKRHSFTHNVKVKDRSRWRPKR